MLAQEKMAAWLVSVKLAFDKRGSRLHAGWTAENMMKLFNMGTDVTKPFEYLLATGNLSSKTGRTAQGVDDVVRHFGLRISKKINDFSLHLQVLACCRTRVCAWSPTSSTSSVTSRTSAVCTEEPPLPR